MANDTSDCIRFGAFEFDPETMELRREGEPVPFPPQPAQVLALLLESPGRVVTREQLKQKVWRGRVVEFDAGLNFAILQIRKALGDQAQSPVYIETVRRRGYRFIGRIEDGGQSEADAGSPASRPTTDRRMIAAAAFALLLSGGILVWRSTLGGGEDAVPKRMLAILPFKQIGPSRGDDLSEGLTEDLITEVANLSPAQLGVIAPTSAARFEDDSDLETVRSALSVDYVVRGAVREADGKTLITVRLVRASDGGSVWAERFERTRNDALDAQVDIARGIAGALSVKMLGSSAGRSREMLPESIRESFLTARWLLSDPTESNAERALQRLDSIRSVAPDYAPAWALTASARRRVGALSEAEEAAREALRLDGNLADAHEQLGYVLELELHLNEALEEYRRAAELEPGIARHHQALANLLANLLRFDESLAELKVARRLDPVSNSLNSELSYIFTAAGLNDEAIRHCAGSLELTPEALWAHECLFTAYYFGGQTSAAASQVPELMRLQGASEEAIASVGHDSPDADVHTYFAWSLEHMNARRAAGETIVPYYEARIRAALLDRECTLASLRAVVEARAPGTIWIAKDVWFSFLHGDPDFEALLAQAGLPSTRDH